MKVRAYFGKVSFIILGTVMGIAIAECGIRIVKGSPTDLNTGKDFYFRYIDIYDRFIIKDMGGGMYINNRPGSNTFAFPVKKPSNEKRVFIIGESVAYFFDSSILQNIFNESFPNFQWRIINCGMGSYDSYRIKLVAKEIVRYEPDVVILMMGNNDWWSVKNNPVTINSWIYRYRFLSRLWVSRMITEYINPPQNIDMKYLDKYFTKNLFEIENTLHKRNIPLVVCTLPRTAKIAGGESRCFDVKESFPAWWLTWRNPRAVIKMLPKDSMDRDVRWLLGNAYEKIGLTGRANEYFRVHTMPFNTILREIVKGKDSFILVDFEKTVLDMTNSSPGLDCFRDELHYLTPMYKLLAYEIAESLCVHRQEYSAVLNWARLTDTYKKISVSALNEENKHYNEERISHFPESGEFNPLLFLFDESHIMARIDIIKYFYKVNPLPILEFRKLMKLKHLPKDVDAQGVARSYFLAGESLRELGKYEEALLCLNDSIEIDKNNYCGYLFRGLCHYDMQQKQLAERDFQKLKDIKPDCAWLTVEYLDQLSAENK